MVGNNRRVHTEGDGVQFKPKTSLARAQVTTGLPQWEEGERSVSRVGGERVECRLNRFWMQSGWRNWRAGCDETLGVTRICVKRWNGDVSFRFLMGSENGITLTKAELGQGYHGIWKMGYRARVI